MSKASIKERNKAIRLAWERERELVSEGKGTRNWSQEQQKDILDPNKGKAYDENGRPFEGQHMKSAAEYPEYQGDPDNIQFLTREEHLEAHKGNWQNPTNWYYSPETKEFVDFGENKPVPCEAIRLSEPVRSRIPDGRANGVRSKEPAKTKTAVSPKANKGLEHKLLQVVGAVQRFRERHPVLTDMIETVALTAAAAALEDSAMGSNRKSSSSLLDEPFGSSFDHGLSAPSSPGASDPPSSGRAHPGERSSPEEHTVPAHGQRYHTRDGVIWKEKKPYQRGHKHDDD